MNFIDRLSNGWQIAKNSLKVLQENRQLIIFPILSGIALVLITGSFFLAMLGLHGWDMDNLEQSSPALQYGSMFIFYIINYFVIVFFNMALIHCTSLYFKGEEPTIQKGISFSMSRIKYIFAWSVLAASVGMVLRLIQENVGSLGKIITGIIGIVWGIATFFVVPVIAYENLGPIDAFKRSASIMKEKWGERIGAGFSFGLITLIGILAIGLAGFLIGYAIHPIAGVAVAVLGFVLLAAFVSALKTIFVSAVYHNVNGDPVANYNEQFVNNLFITKK
ncbi:MAG: DUF6159 family protein [Chitinophagaceae bacterium]